MKTKGYYSSGSVNSSGGPRKLNFPNDSVSPMNSPKESVLMRYLRSGIPSDLDYSSSPSKSRTIVNYLKSGSSKSSSSSKSPLSAVENLKDDVLVMDGILVDSTNSPSKSAGKFRSPDSLSKSRSNLYKTEFCMPEKENSEAYRYQLAHGQEEKRSIPNRARNKIKWDLMVLDPYYSPQSSTYSLQSSTHNSPQSNSSEFALETMATPSPPKATNSKFSKALPILSKDAPTVSPNLTCTDWSPLDDGITVNLPSSTGGTPSREAVDEHIHSVVYCPTQKKRLPCFVDICPN